MRDYIWNIGVWLSQGLNAVFRGGSPDETLSSVAGKAKHRGKAWADILCWFLDRVDPGHCEKSIEDDEGDPVDKARKAGL